MPVPVNFGILRKLRRSLLYLLAVFTVSVIGYLSFGWSLIDSVYRGVITMFSVGFEEVHPVVTVWQKIFTMLVIIGGTTGGRLLLRRSNRLMVGGGGLQSNKKRQQKPPSVDDDHSAPHSRC